jgi:hypothetical protein
VEAGNVSPREEVYIEWSVPHRRTCGLRMLTSSPVCRKPNPRPSRHPLKSAMKLFVTIISIVSFLLPTIAAPLESRALQPAFDPFYTPPSGWESQPVGTILNTRNIIPATLGLFPNIGLQGWQLLYRTQGANGEPLTTVTTILNPLGAKTDRLLAYTFAEDGNNRKCAPSYNCEFARYALVTSAKISCSAIPRRARELDRHCGELPRLLGLSTR